MTLRDTHTDLVHIGLMIGMTAVSIVMCVIFFFFQFLEILRKALAYINAVNASIRLSDCLSVCVCASICVFVCMFLICYKTAGRISFIFRVIVYMRPVGDMGYVS